MYIRSANKWYYNIVHLNCLSLHSLASFCSHEQHAPTPHTPSHPTCHTLPAHNEFMSQCGFVIKCLVMFEVTLRRWSLWSVSNFMVIEFACAAIHSMVWQGADSSIMGKANTLAWFDAGHHPAWPSESQSYSQWGECKIVRNHQQMCLHCNYTKQNAPQMPPLIYTISQSLKEGGVK